MGSSFAAWVQAIGSIAAIGAGFAYHAWQANMALRRKLEVAIDAVDAIADELQMAQDGSRENFPEFDTRKLRLIAECLDEEAQNLAAPFKDQLAIKEIMLAVGAYISQWEADSDHLRDDLYRSFDVMDTEGKFEEVLSQAKAGLRDRLHELRRCPFRMY